LNNLLSATIETEHFLFTLKTNAMRRLIKLSRYSLFFFAVLILAASCNDGTEAKKNTTTIEKEETTSIAITGTLNNLWVEKADFDKLDNSQLVFSFAFRTKDTLTLHGWSCKGPKGSCKGDYQTEPNIKLIKGKSSGVAYGPVVYFGNIIIKNKDVIKLQNGYKTYKYFVFVPTIKNGFIYYSIKASNNDPRLIEDLILDDTSIEANPSPPKGFEDNIQPN
jgi:hypothetical protein